MSVLRVSVTLLFGLGLVVLLAVLFEPRDRTFLVEVETGSLTLRPDGAERATWRLPVGTVLCYRQPSTAPRDSGPLRPLCPGGPYRSVKADTELEFYWPEGLELDLRSDGAGGLVLTFVSTQAAGSAGSAVTGVRVSTGLDALPVRSLILLPRRVLAGAGALPFSGPVEIGGIPDGGATGLVASGRYSARQVPLFRSDPVEVQSGAFTRGDRVRVELDDRKTPVKVYGFVIAGQGRAAFSVVAMSQPARAELVVERYSGDPSRIAPSWVDRALQDPLLLGVSAVLGTLSILFGFLKDLWSMPMGGRKAGRTEG